MSAMLSKLEDGHATLDSPDHHYEYDGWFRNYPANYAPDFVDVYLGPSRRATSDTSVEWGHVGGGVGYLRISTFQRGDIGAGVDSALSALGDSLSGLIIDVRSNGGGSDAEAEAVAGHFTHDRVLYGYHRYKSGPGHDDFGPRIPDYVEPTGAHGYYGPVALLTNRGVYSAAEDFVLAMRALSQVTTVGDTTGGGSGNPIARELPNGWVVHIPRWQLWGADGTFFEGVGLAPDVPAQITESDRQRARDTILERARQLLLQGGSGP
jgi:C-terminal processing protease CtpA/Prc